MTERERSRRVRAYSMPLREALEAQTTGRLIVPACGGCGQLLGQPFRPRPLQEV